MLRRKQYWEGKQAEKAAKLGSLVEKAPSLGKSRSTQLYAFFTAAISVLALAGFYYTVKIVDASRAPDRPPASIEVEPAPEIKAKEIDKVLARIEEEAAETEARAEQQLEELKSINLLEEGTSSPGD